MKIDLSFKLVVVDCEAENSGENVPGGWKNLAAVGLSVCCLWVGNLWGEGKFQFFGKKDLDRAAQILAEAGRVISFNGKAFDLPLMEAILQKKIPVRDHFDILEKIEADLGHKVSLENICRSTLAEGKIGHGRGAIQKFQEGDTAALYNYNMEDVRLTRDAYFFTQKYGHLLCWKEQRFQVISFLEEPPGSPKEAEERTLGGGPSLVSKKIAPRPPSIEPITERQTEAIRRLLGWEWAPTPGMTKQQASKYIGLLREVSK